MRCDERDPNVRIAMKTVIKSILALVLLSAIGGGGYYGYYTWQKRDAAGADNKYRAVPARMGDVTQSVSANGTLNPVVLVNVGTQVSGIVKALRADFNDFVKAGQVLLELDPDLLQSQVRQTEAGLANARAALELAHANETRAKTLFAQEYISRQEMETAAQAVKAAQAQVDQTSEQLAKDRTNLAYAVIRSPVSGVVVSRAVDLGQTVAASFQTPTLFQIAQDLRKMQIFSNFAEADVGKIKVGQPVKFSVDAFPDRSFAASVRQIRLNATTLQNVVTYNVVVAVDNPDLSLLPGMTAYVSVIIDRREDALLVPNAALRFRPEGTADRAAKRGADDGKAGGGEKAGRVRSAEGRPAANRRTVQVLAKGQSEGPLRPVQVTLGISDGRFTEVTGGELKAGEEVVTGIVDTSKPVAPTTGTFRMRFF